MDAILQPFHLSSLILAQLSFVLIKPTCIGMSLGIFQLLFLCVSKEHKH